MHVTENCRLSSLPSTSPAYSAGCRCSNAANSTWFYALKIEDPNIVATLYITPCLSIHI